MKKAGLFFVVALITCVLTAQINPNGLIAYYPLDAHGNNAFKNANHLATFGTVVYEAGQNDSSAYFNNSVMVDSVGVADSIIANNEFSILLWANLKSFNPTVTYPTMFEVGEGLFLRWKNENIEYGYPSGTKWITITFEPAGTTGSWHHYALVKRADSLELWYDGSKVSVIGGAKRITNFGKHFTLGCGLNDNIFNYDLKRFDGWIDEVFVYNRSISPTEVENLKNNNVKYLSVKDVAETKIVVYPNPVLENLTIDFEPNTNNATVEVFTLYGQNILTVPYSNTINVSSLPAGMYLVKIIDGAEIKTFRISK